MNARFATNGLALRNVERSTLQRWTTYKGGRDEADAAGGCAGNCRYAGHSRHHCYDFVNGKPALEIERRIWRPPRRIITDGKWDRQSQKDNRQRADEPEDPRIVDHLQTTTRAANAPSTITAMKNLETNGGAGKVFVGCGHLRVIGSRTLTRAGSR